MSKVNQAVTPPRPKAAKPARPPSETQGGETQGAETQAAETPDGKTKSEGGVLSQALRRAAGKLGLNTREKD